MKYDKKRRRLQLYFLLLWVVILLQLIIGVSGIAHNYCPQAAVCFGCLNLGQNLGNWMYPGAIILGLVIFVLTMFLGRQFCGTVCPFGTMQDLIFSLNKKASKRNYKAMIPVKTHNALKYFKYLILLWVAVSAWLGINYIYMQACPVLALGHPQNLTVLGATSLFIIIVIGYFIERFWCLYLCPYGALLNISQFMGRILHIPRKKVFWNKDCCIDCNLCNDYCPMRIEVSKSEAVVDVECIHCQRCTLCCPVLKKQKNK
ncbi:MAG: 4Fe-4S binding protein [Candidatus Cloacimonetes bacterium]|nr:4Fe-4S binding protein [Candidatus Cloacimonadota bacterium]